MLAIGIHVAYGKNDTGCVADDMSIRYLEMLEKVRTYAIRVVKVKTNIKTRLRFGCDWYAFSHHAEHSAYSETEQALEGRLPGRLLGV